MGDRTRGEDTVTVWRSRDPRVLAAAERADDLRRAWYAAVEAFECEYDVRVHVRAVAFGAGLTIDGVGVDAGRLPGRWRRPDPCGVRRPYRDNVEGHALLARFTIVLPGLPGLPAASERTRPEFLFLADGEAWAKTDTSDGVDPDLWERSDEASCVAALRGCAGAGDPTP